MTERGYAADQCRLTFRDPAQDEEGRLDTGVVEQREQTVGVPLDAALQGAPLVPGDDAIEHADVEVILHVYRHRVDNLRRNRHQRPRCRTTVFTVSKMMNRSSRSERFLM